MLYLSLSHFAISPFHRMGSMSCVLLTSKWNPDLTTQSITPTWCLTEAGLNPLCQAASRNRQQTSETICALWGRLLRILFHGYKLMAWWFFLSCWWGPRRLCLQPAWFVLWGLHEIKSDCWLVWLNPLQIPVSPWIRLVWFVWDLGWNNYLPWFFTSANIDVKLFCRCRLAFLTSLWSITLEPQCCKCLVDCSVYTLFTTTCILTE